MDLSNASLAAEAARSGTSVGAIYGKIGALSVSHHDQFVEMVAPWMNGDPTDKRLVALVSDGWHYLCFIGFDSLGYFHDYWT